MSSDSLIDKVHQFEARQQGFIQSEVQHLRELAVLNRMADALAQRRSYRQIVADTVREAGQIAQASRTWIIEPDAAGDIRTIHTADRQSDQIDTLPLEARDLAQRIVQEQPGYPLSMPHYDPVAAGGTYMGLAIQSSKHMMGALVVYLDDPDPIHNSHTIRILQSILHQTAVACENARVFEAMSGMIIDMVIALALAIESRDPYTGGHVMRVTGYALMLAEKAGMDRSTLSVLRLGGLLHDIGKVAVPDAILQKPAPLNDAEFALMKNHAAVGSRIIKPIAQLAFVNPVVRSHHERYDGGGYPDGLAGEHIPLAARITAIADTFDAMITDRPYRRGLDVDVALQEIAKHRGSQFDPHLADVFIQCTPDDLGRSLDSIRRWRSADRRPDASDLIDLLPLNLPRAA